MKYILSAAAAAALLAGAQVASAQEMSRPWLPASPWYVSMSSAASFANDTNFNSGGSLSYDPGFIGFLGVGYRITPWIAAELEAGYLWLPFDRVSVSGIGSAQVNGSFNGFVGFGNVVLTYPNLNYMAPYIGAVVGLVHRFDSAVTIAGVSTSTGSGTDFAAQAKVGIDFRLTGSMSIAPEYRFMWVNSSGNGLSNTNVHSVGASLKFRF